MGAHPTGGAAKFGNSDTGAFEYLSDLLKLLLATTVTYQQL